MLFVVCCLLFVVLAVVVCCGLLSVAVVCVCCVLDDVAASCCASYVARCGLIVVVFFVCCVFCVLCFGLLF